MKHLEMEFPELPYAVEEALNRLRINIKFCGKNTKIILVISSTPNEGKSMVSTWLWKKLAEAGLPSVLVDMDLRSSVRKDTMAYKTEGEVTGVDYYLSGLSEYQDVVYSTNVENGYMIPISTLLENPSTLLEDPRLEELLDRLSQDYRYVIVDAPPLDRVSDGALIASYCDGAIMVVRSGVTSKKLVRQSLQQLERVRCRLLGMVLNRVETKSRAYSKYYGYGYGKYGKYYYGSGSGE